MIGKTINGFTIKHKIGEGGMSEVWYAEDGAGNPAAIKFLLKRYCKDAVVSARFENEARVMLQLNHPYIRQAYDYKNVEGRPCIVMEYLEGADLKAVVRDYGRIDSETASRYWDEVVSALAYTHALGVIHRDIKPSNIFLTKGGHVKLLDFGIAKVRDAVTGTQTGQKLGTLLYMSPEQITDSKHVDARTDLYSLAVTFVFLLSGHVPYNAGSSSEYVIMNHIVQKPLDLSDIPADWKAFLRPYLAKNPRLRPALRMFPEDGVLPEAFVVDTEEPDVIEISDDLIGNKTDERSGKTSAKSGIPLWVWLLLGIVAVALLLALAMGH